MKFEVRTDQGTHGFLFTRVYAIFPDGDRVQVYSETKIGKDGVDSEGWAHERIAEFQKTDRKCFQAYCRGENETHNVLSFLKWIEDNDYHFRRDDTTYCVYIAKKGDYCHEFHGNLREYSSAFSFYIFDEKLLNEIRRFVERNKRDYRKKFKD